MNHLFNFLDSSLKILLLSTRGWSPKFATWLNLIIGQKVLNRWSKLSEQKLRFSSKVIFRTKKSWGGCHHLLLVYDASKHSTVCVVKSPVLGLQRAFFQKSWIFFKSENLKKWF